MSPCWVTPIGQGAPHQDVIRGIGLGQGKVVRRPDGCREAGVIEVVIPIAAEAHSEIKGVSCQDRHRGHRERCRAAIAVDQTIEERDAVMQHMDIRRPSSEIDAREARLDQVSPPSRRLPADVAVLAGLARMERQSPRRPLT